MSVNRAHSVNEGKLDGISANQPYSITKGFFLYSFNQASVG